MAQTEVEGEEFARDVRARARRFGRDDPIVFLPGLATMIGSTEVEVKRREKQGLWDLLSIEYGLGRVAVLLQIDPARLELDKPMPADVKLPDHGMQTFAAATLRRSARQLDGPATASHGGRQHWTSPAGRNAGADR